ncbi:MAG: DUF882 domain-containing protein [Bdellovibrionales bacterium]|nr:DUF882 domain-containing protein [Bdellovibrionales bacterium]
MQNSKIKFITTAALCLILITSCDFSGKKMSPPRKKSPAAPPTRKGSLACYLSICFETTATDDIDDPNKDYVYPDPEKFSDQSMQPQYIKPSYLLDLNGLTESTPVATNFKLGDFMAMRKGRYALFSSDVVTTIQLIRNEVNRAIFITSGYRSPGYNKNIDGAATWSRHTYGDALDFYVDGMKISELPKLCNNHNASFTLTYETHIHCDWRKSKLDPAFYISKNDKIDPTRREESIVKMIANESRILLNAIDNHVELSTELPLHEDEEGQPTHEWLVTLPTGEIITSQSPTLSIPKSSGSTHVKVTVGGSIHIEDTLRW